VVSEVLSSPLFMPFYFLNPNSYLGCAAPGGGVFVAALPLNYREASPRTWMAGLKAIDCLLFHRKDVRIVHKDIFL